MSSGHVSSFHSSSDCSTAHVSFSRQSSDDTDGMGFSIFPETTKQINASLAPTAASAVTLRASDAFASPRSGPTAPGEILASYTPTPSSARRGATGRQRISPPNSNMPAALSTSLSLLAPSSRDARSDLQRGAKNVTRASGSNSLPPLPPSMQQSSVLSASGSGLASQYPLTPARELRASMPDGSLRSGTGTAAQPLAQVTTAADDKSSWWTSVRQLVSNRGEQVNSYLESLVNPGGTAAAAAAEARAAYAARLRENTRPPRVPTRRAVTSRSTSLISGTGVTYDPTRRSLPTRPPSLSSTYRSRRTLFEPYNTLMPPDDPDSRNSEGPFEVPLDLVVIDPSQDRLLWNNPSTAQPVVKIVNQDAMNDSFMGANDETDSDVDGYDGEPNAYVVDLLSALRGYQSNQSEPFGHLVAAALASRSKEMPVRGFEIAAAEHNPYLVRMILDSGTLDETDVEAQRNVQETMDELFSINQGELSPAIYEYLTSFFRMPFVRLSHKQYTLLKRSGFEYIKLMYDHQHVLPDEPLHSILINQSRAMQIINLIFMIVQLCAIVFSTVAIALVLVNWILANNGSFQSYGFYTLIVFGAGWALNLICIICTVRTRQDESQYEPRNEDGEYLLVPSPYVAVVPVLPLFDIFCLIAYFRALRQKRMILAHNIVACSRVSSIFYAIIFAFPQLITQAYFNNIEVSIDPMWRHRWPYIVLLVAATAQWCVALFGYAWFLLTHDSIDGFGFACFDIGKEPHPLERHSAVAHVLHYVMASLLETNIFLLATAAIHLPMRICNSHNIAIVVLSSITIVYILVVYIFIILKEASTVRISFSCVPLLIIQLVLLIFSERIDMAACAALRNLYFRQTFIFGYLSWGAYFLLFLLWLILMIQWCVLWTTEVNFSPRLLWPLVRKDTRFAIPNKKDTYDSTSPTDSSNLTRPGDDGGGAAFAPL